MSHAVIEYAEDPANFDVVPIKTHIRCDWVPQVGDTVDVKYGRVDGKDQFAAAKICGIGKCILLFISNLTFDFFNSKSNVQIIPPCIYSYSQII